MEHEAIYALYPNAKKINGTTAYDENDNIIEIDMSAVETKVSELETAKANEENQKATDKANGNQKLLDLGLTQAEATALTGYTPPVAE
jgi:hypothetical protein